MVIWRYILIAIGMLYFSLGAIGKHSREIVHDSWTSKAKLEVAIDSLKGRDDALSMAYLGLCESMMANHVSWPGTKLEYFNKGKKKVEKACLKDAWSTEIKYIRLMIQLNAPAFLGYNSNIEADFAFFCKFLKQEKIPLDWKQKFINELLKVKGLDDKKMNELGELKKEIV